MNRLTSQNTDNLTKQNPDSLTPQNIANNWCHRSWTI